jgi:hypothetical protein
MMPGGEGRQGAGGPLRPPWGSAELCTGGCATVSDTAYPFLPSSPVGRTARTMSRTTNDAATGALGTMPSSP